MGLFLSLSGIIGAESGVVQNVLREYAATKSMVFELAKGSTDELGMGVITRGNQNTTILYPADFMDWDEASQFLSKQLSAAVFSFHIHDGDLWMYTMFNRGEEVDWFNPVPEYWEDNLPREEREKWKGNPELVAQLIPSVSVDSIDKYFTTWNVAEEIRAKAYSDDEFTFCDCWQMCDFMKRVNLDYPMGGDGAILGDSFYLGGKHSESNLSRKESSRKPWWKIW